MKFIADFHIHSKYSRATSKDMDLEHIAEWAKLKGIELMGTGDFTHPLWLSELKKKLKPMGNGLFEYNGIKFILTSEVSSIYSKDGKVRKIHNMMIAPSFEAVDKIVKELGRIANLTSDGRPIMGLPAKGIMEIVMSASPQAVLIPCHAWTPWFSIFGANSGFDSIEECFEEYSANIFAIETGLSSDPAMNWRLSKLDNISFVSCSDAHSPAKIGREACVFDTDLSYKAVMDAIKSRDQSKFLYTIEFFPEEGKYHYDGHRNCGILWSPDETKKHDGICPKCKRKVTVGVMNRVDSLADRTVGFDPPHRVPFVNLVPLPEIIGEALEKSPATKAVDKEYRRLLSHFGSEFKILLDIPIEELVKFSPGKISEGIKRVREGKLSIVPGYDGVYGKINIFNGKEEHKSVEPQTSLF